MTTLNQNIDKLLEDSPICRAVIRHSEEEISCVTNFTYSDGSSIEIFIISDNNNGFYITDYCQTFALLSDLGIENVDTQIRSDYIKNVLRRNSIHIDNGRLFKKTNTSDLMNGIIKITQAAVEISALVVTRKARDTQSRATDVWKIVSDISKSRNIKFEQNKKISLSKDKIKDISVKFDGYVEGHNKTLGIFLLFRDNYDTETGFHQRCQKVFTNLYDLKTYEWSGTRIVAADPLTAQNNEREIKRIKGLGDVIDYQSSDFISTLKQAA